MPTPTAGVNTTAFWIKSAFQPVFLGRWTWTLLKLGSPIFYQIFIIHQMIPLQKLRKTFLFHLKSFFRSRDIQIFVFSSSPLFFPVSHCFRGWFKKNLKVYDVINCISKNLIAHFETEIRCDIETLLIDRLSIK